jgi:predicted regulator of Ras-like GTPase activity (Roadblock/LC7/MglB family)
MFQAILETLLQRTRGARWAMVVGTDGVLLDAAPRGLPDAEILAAEFASLYRGARKSLAATGGEDLSSVTLLSRKGKLIFQFLTPEYFLMLDLGPTGNSGRASFEIARICGMLERELVF